MVSTIYWKSGGRRRLYGADAKRPYPVLFCTDLGAHRPNFSPLYFFYHTREILLKKKKSSDQFPFTKVSPVCESGPARNSTKKKKLVRREWGCVSHKRLSPGRGGLYHQGSQKTRQTPNARGSSNISIYKNALAANYSVVAFPKYISLIFEKI